MEKFVVVSAKPMNGSRVMSAAMSEEKARQSLANVEACERLAKYGPFGLIPAAEAEKKKLYGD